MKDPYLVEKKRESSSLIHGNRKYFRKGVSPDSYISPFIKSNQ